jgi:hypothetical protein
MGKPKDRAKEKEKYDKLISIRVNSTLLQILKDQAKTDNVSKAINESIKKFVSYERDKDTGYECYSCNKKILEQELYFCTINQLEVRTNEGIIPTKGEPTNILCMKCAKKNPPILKFIESEDEEEGDLVVETSRKI